MSIRSSVCHCEVSRLQTVVQFVDDVKNRTEEEEGWGPGWDLSFESLFNGPPGNKISFSDLPLYFTCNLKIKRKKDKIRKYQTYY